MFRTPHYVTGEFKARDGFLPAEVYSKVLDCIVKACTDIMIVNPKGEILLGKRKVYPQPDWWLIGGRMRAGETETSIKRLLQRELHFTLDDLSRLRTIAYYTYCFGIRNEEPRENGNADLAAVLSLSVNQEEYVVFHPALKNATRDLLAMRVWDQIEALTNIREKGSGDGGRRLIEQQIADLVQQFVHLKSSIPTS